MKFSRKTYTRRDNNAQVHEWKIAFRNGRVRFLFRREVPA